MLTDQYVKDHGRLPGEKARHGLGWQAAQDTRPEKKTPRPLKQLLAWWKASALLKFGKQMVDGLLERCRAAGAAIRARVDPAVDVALAAVDVAVVVFTVREKFSRRHILAEARRHLLETLRGRAFPPGLDDSIADRALLRYSRRHTVTKPGREAPAADRMTYTADFPVPDRWWIADAEGTPPRESSRYERARLASLAVQGAIRDTRIQADTATEATTTTSAVSAPADARDLDEGEHDQAPPHAVDHPGRDAALTPAQRSAAVHAHLQAAMPQEYAEGRTADPETWTTSPERLAALAKLTATTEARSRALAEADAHHRAIEERESPLTDPATPGGQRRWTAGAGATAPPHRTGCAPSASLPLWEWSPPGRWVGRVDSIRCASGGSGVHREAHRAVVRQGDSAGHRAELDGLDSSVLTRVGKRRMPVVRCSRLR